MKLNKLAWIPLTVVTFGSLAAVAQAQDKAQTARIEKVLTSPERSAAQQAEDQGRKPLQVVQFLGIESGDTVVDVFAGGGYYDIILSAAVGPEGTVYSQNAAFATKRPGFEKKEKARVEQLGNMVPIHGSLPDGIAGEADAAFIGLNFHDVYNRGGSEAGQKLLRGIHAALKPGGVLGLTDHIGVAGRNNAKLHRIPIDVVEAQLRKAGFVIKAESDLLRNPDDPHTSASYEHGPLRWHTDRILIRAVKPE